MRGDRFNGNRNWHVFVNRKCPTFGKGRGRDVMLSRWFRWGILDWTEGAERPERPGSNPRQVAGRQDVVVTARLPRRVARTRTASGYGAPASHNCCSHSETLVVDMEKMRFARPRASLRKLRNQLVECSRFPERVLFLDIETTGLRRYDDITVIGWSFGGCANTLVKGNDTTLLREDFQQAKFLVTFNGGRFDAKFVAREFPEMVFPRAHMDLMYLCRGLGLTGGQKEIEKTLGIDLRYGMRKMNGVTAVALWRKYVQGDREALRRLILYNRVDVAALGAILDEVVSRMNLQTEVSIGKVRFRDWSAPAGWQTVPDVS